MGMMTINKNLLRSLRFSNRAVAWLLQAQSFYHAAVLLQKGRPAFAKGAYISSESIYLSDSSYKIACYLLAHAIELCLKALYCENAHEDIEKFSHNAIKLTNALVERKILEKNEIDSSDLELINIFLEWYGRYHKPLTKKLEDTIHKSFIPTLENPDMLKPKFSIDKQTFSKLSSIAENLLSKIALKPSSMDHLLFDIF